MRSSPEPADQFAFIEARRSGTAAGWHGDDLRTLELAWKIPRFAVPSILHRAAAQCGESLSMDSVAIVWVTDPPGVSPAGDDSSSAGIAFRVDSLAEHLHSATP